MKIAADTAAFFIWDRNPLPKGEEAAKRQVRGKELLPPHLGMHTCETSLESLILDDRAYDTN